MTKIDTTRQLINKDFLAILQQYKDCNTRVDSFTATVKMIVVEAKVHFGVIVTEADFDGPVPVDGYYSIGSNGLMRYLSDLVQPGSLERAHFLGHDVGSPGHNELKAALERWSPDQFATGTESEREPNPPSSRHEVIGAGNGNYTYPRVKQNWRH